MATETYHEDMLDHLAIEQQRVNVGISDVYEIVGSGQKYRSAERASLVIKIKGACGHLGCPVAANYKGNPRPRPTPPPPEAAA